MGWIILITFCMTLGDLDTVIDSPTFQPYIQVFYDATQSYAGASVLSALVISMAVFCNLSIVVSFVVSCLLALINIGSTIALNNITSISLVSILSSYIVSIGCIFWRRLTNQPMLPAKFTLSKPVGLVLNGFSLVFLVFVYVFSFFPGVVDPTVAEMNWSILIYGAVIGFALLHYFISARHVYDGPVEYVRKL
jgi:choline transport protein